MSKYQSLADFDLYNCPLCDGVTVAIWCDECNENHCKGCYEAYGCEWCE